MDGPNAHPYRVREQVMAWIAILHQPSTLPQALEHLYSIQRRSPVADPVGAEPTLLPSSALRNKRFNTSPLSASKTGVSRSPALS
jgi:hypothetical protein